MAWFDEMFPPIELPECERGPWKIERFTVSKREADFFNIRNTGRFIRQGNYIRLRHERRGVIMSNTPAELHDHIEPVDRAKGNVLLHGLGLGVVLTAILAKPEVESVTVVEIDEDVLELVGPYYTDPRVTLVHGNALTWQPPKGIRYNVVWHDIWDGLCEDNLPEMKTLHRRYGRRTDWQGSWARDWVEYYRRAG